MKLTASVLLTIVWQCRRTTELVEELCSDPAVREQITARTGLIPDAYYSASKIAWVLRTVPRAREQAEAGDLMFGTVDSWLIWSLQITAYMLLIPPMQVARCFLIFMKVRGTHGYAMYLISP